MLEGAAGGSVRDQGHDLVVGISHRRLFSLPVRQMWA